MRAELISETFQIEPVYSDLLGVSCQGEILRPAPLAGTVTTAEGIDQFILSFSGI